MNNSDSNTYVRVPDEIKKWNWSAFFLTFIWGLPNKIYFSLLVFVPFLGFIVPFILGAKGNEWAWEKNNWNSVESFKRSQKKWVKITIIIIFSIIILSALIITVVSSTFSKMEITTDSLKILNNNREAVSLLGENIEKGFMFMGSINISGDNGDANISFPVEGTKSKGKLYVKANKEMGIWEIERLILSIEGKNARLNLLEDN